MRVFRHLGIALLALVPFAVAVRPAEAVSVVGYYTFDNQDAADLSSFMNHGTVGASVTFTTDTPGAIGGGHAARFDGTGGNAGLILVPNSPSLQALDDSLSVAFWIKMDHTANPIWIRVTRKASEANASDGWIINRNNNTSDLLMRTDTTGVGGAFNQNRGQGVGVGMLDGQWHHYVHVRDNGTWTEYVDGVFTGSGAYPHGNGFGNTQPLLIGGRGQNMIRLLDDYSIWNGAISAEFAAYLAARWRCARSRPARCAAGVMPDRQTRLSHTLSTPAPEPTARCCSLLSP